MLLPGDSWRPLADSVHVLLQGSIRPIVVRFRVSERGESEKAREDRERERLGEVRR